MANKCRDCRFWHDLGDGEDGECRIRAPLMRAQLVHIIDDSPMEDACWPWTMCWHWCGEFSPRAMDNQPEATDAN
jgi:hypothetical protein